MPGRLGGPLYLLTDYGAFLVGTTSRAYLDATTYCSEGGIYARPDKIVSWIEGETGIVPRGPSPSADTLLVAAGTTGRVAIEAHDPRGDIGHDFAITAPPAHGNGARRRRRARVHPRPRVPRPDRVNVLVSDPAQPGREVPLTVPIEVIEEVGGCCSSSRDAGSGSVLALAVAFLLARRRATR